MRKAKVVSEKHTSEQVWEEMTSEAIQNAEEKHEKMQQKRTGNAHETK